MDLRYFAILFILPLHIFALDLDKLKSLGISENVYISDIAVYFNKAFLAIPRTVCTSNVTQPTLLDVPWKEHLNVILKSRFNKPMDGQVWANCRNLQNAISLAKEGAKSKLWILDKGNEFCPAKLRAYNMFHGIFLNEDTIELAQVSKSNLNTIVIEDEPTLGNHRAFIANAGDNKVLVCYLSALACQHLSLLSGENSANPGIVDLLSISRVDSRMFMTSTRSRKVYSVDLDQITAQYEEEQVRRLNA
ncbi:uncharacterized protein LOC125503427 [Dendroctonus ponderosae]|uniref:uncharacterized protein LOC125503427 n=1 Tax=Dendroctonus ponderosae TaxID=77166 RepID=UPI0020355023|nr:uncharacterized protein LOC125503427 [Dendroctonus ponderosae]